MGQSFADSGGICAGPMSMHPPGGADTTPDGFQPAAGVACGGAVSLRNPARNT